MKCLSSFITLLAFAVISYASEVFVEAESFATTGGWTVLESKQASGLAMLGGAGGTKDGVATKTVSIKDAGHYKIWVRYTSHPKWRGPFHVAALSGTKVLGERLFDETFEAKSTRDTAVWKSFEADLPEGEVTLRLTKHENKNSGGASRQVDCLLLTMNDKLVPNHLHFGSQTFVRVKLGDGYERPVYVHVFADHFHAPWYQHFALSKAGATTGVSAKKADLLKSGERTPWCNITPMIYQDSGAMLHITTRHAYTEPAERLRATFEFATAPDEKSIVKTITLDNKPGRVSIFLPPNLLTAENRALLKTDREIAEATGKLADAHPWPTHGKKPEKFPFFVSEAIGRRGSGPDEAVRAREQKTLDYFGFADDHLRHIGGAWLMKDGSYCNPDIEAMRAKFQREAAAFKAAGGKVGDIVFCELTDEPAGQTLEFMAKDPSYALRFREWLKALGKTPADLLVKEWDDVRIVTAAQKEQFPALYYFSQRFRTRALGDFMATQRKLAEAAYGGTFPVLANFSDGAVYTGNFYTQGVDYFELLDSPGQNAIWGEDWSNGASTYQCAAFNVDLMRAATRERGLPIGHHLVSYAGRKAWDVKLKATGEVARGVKVLNSFFYGPTWASHEGGPYWRSTAWQAKPETWTANASITREIGAVEDSLLPAMPAPAKVALLYSSSSDIWTVGDTNAYGFDRIHTWLALTHAQVPVDVVSEKQAAKGTLEGYSVCYLSGPNLTVAAAEKLKAWVKAGGTLCLSAGTATRDEYNRPLQVLDEILPASRDAATDLQKFQSSGRRLDSLIAKDEVQWGTHKAEVLAVKQSFQEGGTVLARFKDGRSAGVKGAAGKGTVYCVGFLPALSYIKTALDHRRDLEKKVADGVMLNESEKSEAAILGRSYNPWKFPADVRDLILTPVKDAKVVAPIRCDTPLVDVVSMPHASGILIPLANYTLAPIPRVTLQVATTRQVVRVESVTQGVIPFKQSAPNIIEFTIPLGNNDFLKLHYE